MLVEVYLRVNRRAVVCEDGIARVAYSVVAIEKPTVSTTAFAHSHPPSVIVPFQRKFICTSTTFRHAQNVAVALSNELSMLKSLHTMYASAAATGLQASTAPRLHITIHTNSKRFRRTLLHNLVRHSQRLSVSKFVRKEAVSDAYLAVYDALYGINRSRLLSFEIAKRPI
jgi:hypothetical protein